MAEGLLPVPEKLAQKIVLLEFVEMREMMPETWLNEETSKNILSWLRRKDGSVTDILQWLQCFSAMVGALSRTYPQTVPEFTSTIDLADRATAFLPTLCPLTPGLTLSGGTTQTNQSV